MKFKLPNKNKLFTGLCSLIIVAGLSVGTINIVNSMSGPISNIVSTHSVFADKGGGNKGSGDDETQGNDSQGDEYSFYHLASSAGTYFDGTQNKNTKAKFMEMGKNLRMGDAGGLIGYEDSKYDTKHLMGTLTSSLSNSAQNHAYTSFQQTGLRPLYHYAQYGRALTSMGLDSTATGHSTSTIVRWAMGLVTLVVYSAAVSVPIIFRAIGLLLQAINPFQWFQGAMTMFSGSHFENVLDGDTVASANSNMGGPFKQGMLQITREIGTLYQQSQSWGLYIVLPAFLLFGIAGYLLFNLKIQGTLKKWFIRLLVIVAGVPILGDLYTRTLQEFTNTAEYDPTANIILASTFDDFQGWAENTRLALPANTNIVLDVSNNPAGEVTDSTSTDNKNYKSTNVRDLSMNINWLADNGIIQRANEASNGYNNSALWNNGSMWNSTPMNKVTLSAGYTLLNRYMSDARFTASDYETKYKASFDLQKRKDILAGIKYLATNTNAFWEDGKAYFIEGTQPKNSNGRADYLWDSNYGVTATQGGSGMDNTRHHPTIFTGYGQKGSQRFGLSSLSMYNYLTSSFDDSNITCYSPSKATSDLVEQTHHSVNNVGTGTTRWAYWINAVVLLGTIAIIGWGYAIATILTTVSKVFRIMLHMPLAMMGGLTAAAKLIAGVVVIILQVMITMFAYSLSMDLLMALNMGTSSIMDKAGTLGGSSATIYANGYNGGFIQALAARFNWNTLKNMNELTYLALATILTILMAGIALRGRAEFVSAMSEWVGKLIDKIFSTGEFSGLNTSGASEEAKGMSNGANELGNAINTGSQLLVDKSILDKNNNNNNHTNTKGSGKGSGKGGGKGAKGKHGGDGKGHNGGAIKGADKQTTQTPKGLGGKHSKGSGSKSKGAGTKSHKTVGPKNEQKPINSSKVNSDAKTENNNNQEHSTNPENDQSSSSTVLGGTQGGFDESPEDKAQEDASKQVQADKDGNVDSTVNPNSDTNDLAHEQSDGVPESQKDLTGATKNDGAPVSASDTDKTSDKQISPQNTDITNSQDQSDSTTNPETNSTSSTKDLDTTSDNPEPQNGEQLQAGEDNDSIGDPDKQVDADSDNNSIAQPTNGEDSNSITQPTNGEVPNADPQSMGNSNTSSVNEGDQVTDENGNPLPGSDQTSENNNIKAGDNLANGKHEESNQASNQDNSKIDQTDASTTEEKANEQNNQTMKESAESAAKDIKPEPSVTGQSTPVTSTNGQGQAQGQTQGQTQGHAQGQNKAQDANSPKLSSWGQRMNNDKLWANAPKPIKSMVNGAGKMHDSAINGAKKMKSIATGGVNKVANGIGSRLTGQNTDATHNDKQTFAERAKNLKDSAKGQIKSITPTEVLNRGQAGREAMHNGKQTIMGGVKNIAHSASPAMHQFGHAGFSALKAAGNVAKASAQVAVGAGLMAAGGSSYQGRASELMQSAGKSMQYAGKNVGSAGKNVVKGTWGTGKAVAQNSGQILQGTSQVARGATKVGRTAANVGVREVGSTFIKPSNNQTAGSSATVNDGE